MTKGVDYSSARPDPTMLRNAGYVSVGRYLGSDGRCITVPERDRLFAAGLSIWLIWETYETRLLGGHTAGRYDGPLANQYADQLAAPSWVPIYYAADTDVQENQAYLVAAYLDAVKATSGRPRGIYGGAWLVQAMLDGGHAEYGWVSNASSWNHGKTAPGAHLQQGGYVFGGSCDENTMLKPTWGAWHPDQPSPEDDMTPDQAAQLSRVEKKLDALLVQIDPAGVAAGQQLNPKPPFLRQLVEQIKNKTGA